MNDSGLGITRENLLLIVPPALTHDPSIMALASSDAAALAARVAEIDRVRMIPNIDELPEELLDILARDFKVDWWDPEYTAEEKRRTLKTSWKVHRMMGTKAAVETALSAIYPGASVEEWFQYGGEPYHFRVKVKILDAEYVPAKHKRVLERIAWYKNLRSHMDRIWYELPPITITEEERLIFRNFRVRLRDQATGRLWMVRTQIRTRVRMPHRFGPSAIQAIGGLGVRTEERIPLRLRAGVYAFDNMGGFVRLDGNHKLDGSWLLDQRPRAPRYVDFIVRTYAPERTGTLRQSAGSIRIVHQTRSRTGPRAIAAGVYLLAPNQERLTGRVVPRSIVREREDAPALRMFSAAGGWSQVQKPGIAALKVKGHPFQEPERTWFSKTALSASFTQPARAGPKNVSAGVYAQGLEQRAGLVDSCVTLKAGNAPGGCVMRKVLLRASVRQTYHFKGMLEDSGVRFDGARKFDGSFTFGKISKEEL